MDAIAELKASLEGHTIAQAVVDEEAGDLLLLFESGEKLQVFSLTGYEDWEMSLSDGSDGQSRNSTSQRRRFEKGPRW